MNVLLASASANQSYSSMVTSLTVAIPVLNEESNLANCIHGVGSRLATNIVVIDSGSTDGTVRVARELGAQVIHFDWNGHFPKKRNWYLRNHTPNTEWVLFLDADELLNEAVREEISKSIAGSKHQGFLLSYTNYFLGRRLKGGYPLRKLALFRVGEVEYEHINEENWSSCDMEVHEHPIVNGTIGLIRNRIDHRDLRGLDSYMSKHNQYAAWEARRLFSMRQCQENGEPGLTKQIKYSIISSPWGGLAFFLGSYLLMGGWRDGSVGFAFCMLKAGYFVQIACRLRELESQSHMEK